VVRIPVSTSRRALSDSAAQLKAPAGARAESRQELALSKTAQVLRFYRLVEQSKTLRALAVSAVKKQ
jgi:hypothetical protein